MPRPRIAGLYKANRVPFAGILVTLEHLDSVNDGCMHWRKTFRAFEREWTMKIIVFGGDGFCGWPTALHLSGLGHEIVIVDNLSRRNIDNELETNSLTPIAPMSMRINTWKEISATISNSIISISPKSMTGYCACFITSSQTQ